MAAGSPQASRRRWPSRRHRRCRTSGPPARRLRRTGRRPGPVGGRWRCRCALGSVGTGVGRPSRDGGAPPTAHRTAFRRPDEPDAVAVSGVVEHDTIAVGDDGAQDLVVLIEHGDVRGITHLHVEWRGARAASVNIIVRSSGRVLSASATCGSSVKIPRAAVRASAWERRARRRPALAREEAARLRGHGAIDGAGGARGSAFLIQVWMSSIRAPDDAASLAAMLSQRSASSGCPSDVAARSKHTWCRDGPPGGQDGAGMEKSAEQFGAARAVDVSRWSTAGDLGASDEPEQRSHRGGRWSRGRCGLRSRSVTEGASRQSRHPRWWSPPIGSSRVPVW